MEKRIGIYANDVLIWGCDQNIEVGNQTLNTG